MIDPSLRLAALASLFFATPALTQSTKVIPAAQATAEGNSATAAPFNWSPRGSRYQQVFKASELGRAVLTLNGIAFRRDNDSRRAYAALTTPAMDFMLGAAATTPETMSKLFAANRKGAMQSVYKGTVSLPAVQAGVRSFVVGVKFSKPYTHFVRNGDLLLETTCAAARPVYGWFLDAHSPRSVGSSWMPYGVAAPFKSGERAILFNGFFDNLPEPITPGGALTPLAMGLNSAYPGLAIYGFSRTRYGALKLPFSLGPLGAPGHSLYTSLDVVLPMTPTRQTDGTFTASSRLPIPNSASQGGLKAYAQFLFIDRASNALGVAMSSAIDYTVGPLTKRSSQSVYSTNVNAAEGNWTLFSNVNLGEAPVTEFTGTFR